MLRPLQSGVVGLVVLAAVGCTSGSITPAMPGPTKTFLRDGSAPGFDKRDFPGLEPMQVWMRESPYVWVGYYLQSPCFAGVPWTGSRAGLESQGWGLAVLYVGQQAPGATPNVGAAGAPDCGKKPLSQEQGTIDGDQAVAIAAADGFPAGTTIFLDVERVDPMPDSLRAYARGWISRVLARGYVAGVYAHKLNADDLAAIQREAFRAAESSRTPPLWVVNSVGFALGKSPSESGFEPATVWQNPIDTAESWGGVTFRIDQNVAAQRSPSGP